mgnify:CR=1 FL=1
MGKLSCVIPTLGGKCLENTLDQLQKGSVSPDEVLVCLPEGQALEARIDACPTMRMIHTEKWGQVAQRAKGFQEASGEWILQLDDDVTLEKQCLETMLDCARSVKTPIALAPGFFDSHSSVPLHSEDWRGFFRRANLFIMNGRRGFCPGALTLSGHGFGPNLDEQRLAIQPVEWLSGGCVLHHRRNLVTDDYFPFSGKAYCEDLIHSHYLRERGVDLGVCSRAKCYTERGGNWTSFNDWLGEYRARKYYQRLRSGSWLRMHLWYLAAWMRLALLKVAG